MCLHRSSRVLSSSFWLDLEGPGAPRSTPCCYGNSNGGCWQLGCDWWVLTLCQTPHTTSFPWILWFDSHHRPRKCFGEINGFTQGPRTCEPGGQAWTQSMRPLEGHCLHLNDCLSFISISHVLLNLPRDPLSSLPQIALLRLVSAHAFLLPQTWMPGSHEFMWAFSPVFWVFCAQLTVGLWKSEWRKWRFPRDRTRGCY